MTPTGRRELPFSEVRQFIGERGHLKLGLGHLI